MDKKNRQAIVDISNIVVSSIQILQELPKDELTKMGGEGALVKRTKVNIVDSLSWCGLQEWSIKIKGIDTEREQRMEDFVNNLSEIFKINIMSLV